MLSGIPIVMVVLIAPTLLLFCFWCVHKLFRCMYSSTTTGNSNGDINDDSHSIATTVEDETEFQRRKGDSVEDETEFEEATKV